MTYIKYNEKNPFNVTLVEYDNEMEAIIDGAIKAGQFEVDLINNREALWFNERLTLIRDARSKLLTAFDKYKTNVQYGVATESNSQHSIVVNWYQSLLDLKDEAFINVPEQIKYYIKEWYKVIEIIDKRYGKIGNVCVLKNALKEVEYIPLSEVQVNYQGENISLEKYMTLQDEKNSVLEQKIKSLEEAIAAFEERTTKLMATVSNAATTALQVAQNQSIQIETINQEVFK